jgi:hypothetical protein
MKKRLQDLLDNQPEEEHQAIVKQSHHILFGTKCHLHRQGKFIYDREELKAAIKALPLKARHTTRNLAARLGMSVSL